MSRQPILIALPFVLAACSVVDPEQVTSPTATTRSALTEPNGGNLNGGNLNGGNLNGGNLNGNDLSAFMIGVEYLPASVNGHSNLDALTLDATVFAARKGASHWSGLDFADSAFVGRLGSGDPVTLRVTAMRPVDSGANADLYEYWVEFLGSDFVWHPACRDASGAAVWAIPFNGRWDYRQGVEGGGGFIDDPTQFTFACNGGAIAKCALLGYRPWATHSDGTPLASYHQACTRLLRADYCGDGSSYTENGTWVNLYDPLGIQQDTEDWVFEAHWDEGGARCFYPLNRSHAGVPCYDDRVDYACGFDLLGRDLGIRLTNETRGDGILDGVLIF